MGWDALLAWYAAPVLFGASALFTLIHTYDEVFGGAEPFWEYYARHFGRGVGYAPGLALFAGLAALLVGLAVGGYLLGSELLLGGLLGARLGDAAMSHVGLRAALPGPNPGLATSPLYLAEAAVALALLPVSALGLALGAGAFAGFWVVSFAARAR